MASRNHVRWWGGAVVVVSLVAVGIWRGPWREAVEVGRSPTRDRSVRLDQIRLARPDLSDQDVLDLAARSGAASERMRLAGVAPEEVPDRVTLYRQALVITDDELLAYFHARTDVFGNRPFEECRRSADRMIRIERTMQALEDGEL